MIIREYGYRSTRSSIVIHLKNKHFKSLKSHCIRPETIWEIDVEAAVRRHCHISVKPKMGIYILISTNDLLNQQFTAFIDISKTFIDTNTYLIDIIKCIQLLVSLIYWLISVVTDINKWLHLLISITHFLM